MLEWLRPPFGYRTVDAEKRGQKIKKRLEMDEREAATVRQIFKLFLEGDGTKGPMGIKDIVSWLNRHGFRNKRGNAFFTSCVHRILIRESLCRSASLQSVRQPRSKGTPQGRMGRNPGTANHNKQRIQSRSSHAAREAPQRYANSHHQ